jgi:hypothetical protein
MRPKLHSFDEDSAKNEILAGRNIVNVGTEISPFKTWQHEHALPLTMDCKCEQMIEQRSFGRISDQVKKLGLVVNLGGQTQFVRHSLARIRSMTSKAITRRLLLLLEFEDQLRQ